MTTQSRVEKIRAELTEALFERDKSFPVRTPENTTAVYSLAQEYVDELCKDLNGKAYRPTESALDKCLQIAGKPVFIGGAMKSGTTLLTNLLDNHPKLVVMPGDTHFYKMDTITVDYESMARYWGRRMISPTGQVPFWILGNDDNYRIFLAILRFWFDYYEGHTAQKILAPVLSYYAMTLKDQPERDALRWVAKVPDQELHVAQMFSIFPEARFLHVLRHPFDNVASLAKLCEIRGYRSNPRKVISRSYEYADKNSQKYGRQKYFCVYYDKIVECPEKELESLAEFLEVEYDNNLLTPTVNGKPASQNSMFTRGSNGTINRRAKSKVPDPANSEIHDRMVLELILYETFRRSGYMSLREILISCVRECVRIPKRIAKTLLRSYMSPN